MVGSFRVCYTTKWLETARDSGGDAAMMCFAAPKCKPEMAYGGGGGQEPAVTKLASDEGAAVQLMHRNDYSDWMGTTCASQADRPSCECEEFVNLSRRV